MFCGDDDSIQGMNFALFIYFGSFRVMKFCHFAVMFSSYK